MTASWTKLDDGSWGVRLERAPWPSGTGVGLPVVVRSKSGRRATVVLGEHLRGFRIKGGVFVDVYRAEATI